MNSTTQVIASERGETEKPASIVGIILTIMGMTMEAEWERLLLVSPL